MPEPAIPESVNLHRQSAVLEIHWRSGERHRLPAEYLRVYSPSAEVRGHGGEGQERLQTGKREVRITGLKQVGNYALRLSFDDGHNSGIYSWDYLADLGRRHTELWQQYLDRLTAAGASREAHIEGSGLSSSRSGLPTDTQVLTIKPSPTE